MIIKNFERKPEFKYYNKLDNPFLDITIKLDITNLVNYCKIYKNFTASIGYIISKAVNNIDNFKYRYSKKRIQYFNNIATSYTYLYKNKVLYFDCEYKDNYAEYIEEYQYQKNLTIKKQKSTSSKRNDIIWYSNIPWFSFTSLNATYDKKNTIPQFIWDKIEYIGNRSYINLMIHIHHGFADGYHIHQLINELEKEIKKFKI